jgi:hypothetical protein
VEVAGAEVGVAGAEAGDGVLVAEAGVGVAEVGVEAGGDDATEVGIGVDSPPTKVGVGVRPVGPPVVAPAVGVRAGAVPAPLAGVAVVPEGPAPVALGLTPGFLAAMEAGGVDSAAAACDRASASAAAMAPGSNGGSATVTGSCA